MSTVTETRKFTPDDLLKMPDGERYELVDGNLVERPMSLWSSYVAGKIYGRLDDHCTSQALGWVVPEGATYQCFPDAPEMVRRADVFFIALERLPVEQAITEGHIHVLPDLIVEVLSPNDLVYEVDRKVEEYRAAGVRLIWVVNPDAKTIKIYRLDGSVAELKEHQEITGEDVVPGFRCPIAEFFRLPVRKT